MQSVLGQSAVDLNLFIVDDCSSDTSISTVEQVVSDQRLWILKNDCRLGLVGNWNRCLDLSRSDPILLFHQDDRMRAGFLEHAVAALDRYPDAGFVFSNVETIDADGSALGGHWSPGVLPAEDGYIPGQDLIRLLLANGNIVPCQTVLARAAMYAQAGPFKSSFGYVPDLEMWLRFAQLSGAVYLAHPWVEIRRHPGQESARFIATAREVHEVRRAFQLYFSSAPGHGDSDGISMSEARTLARHHLHHWIIGNFRQSLRQRRWRHAVDFGMCFARFQLETFHGSPC